MKFSQETINVLANYEATEANFKALLFDVATNKLNPAEARVANSRIREVMFDIMGIDASATRKEMKRAFKANKDEIFAILADTIEGKMITGWGNDPFFNRFVDARNLALGDKNEFVTEDDMVLTMSNLADGHHDLFRQKYARGSVYSVVTSNYGVKIFTDFALFATGRVDFDKFVEKVYDAVNACVMKMVYASFGEAAAKLPVQSIYNQTGALDLESVHEIAESVEAANGDKKVIIMGNKAALSKLNQLSDIDYSDEMRNEFHKTGKFGAWEGYEIVEIKRFIDPANPSQYMDADQLLFVPEDIDGFIKLVYEGDAEIYETNESTNRDKTVDYEYQQRMGAAVVIGKIFGSFKITA